MGLCWFGIPAVIVASELIASRATGLPVDRKRLEIFKESLFRLCGSIVFAAAGFTLRYLGG